MNATVTSFGAKGFGFCRTKKGERLYFHLRGHRGGECQTHIKVGMSLDVHDVRDSDYGDDRVAWTWTVGNPAVKALDSSGETTTKTSAVTPVNRYIPRHVHGVVVEDYGILPVSENAPLGYHYKGYCQFTGDQYGPVELMEMPEIGDDVVILNIRNRQTHDGENTGEQIAWKWCLLADFPEHLCGDDFNRPKEQVKGKRFRVFLTNSETSVATFDSIEDAVTFVGRILNKDPDECDEIELEIALEYYRIEERVTHGWKTVVDGEVFGATEAA